MSLDNLWNVYKDKTKKYKSDIFNTLNWDYDEINDEFIRPNTNSQDLKDMPIAIIKWP